MRKCLLLLVVLWISACAGRQGGSLFEPGRALPPESGSDGLRVSYETSIDSQMLLPNRSARIKFPIPGRILTLDLVPVKGNRLALPEGQSAWVAKGPGPNPVFFMRIGNMLEGRLQVNDTIYRLRSKTPKTGVLEVYDANKFREPPNDAVRLPPKPADESGVSADSACQDAADRIDVMVLYTPAARDGSGGVTQIENEIAFAVGHANLALANSVANHRLNLIYTGVVTYTEPAAGVDSNALLGDLSGTADGVLDTIHGLRDSVRADLVSLIFERDNSTDDWCGWGHAVDTANADTTDDSAFTVVRRECAGSNLSFAHEIGHNMGARHDRDNTTPANSDHNYNFGHIQPIPSSATDPPWRTVMSYRSPCSDTAATGSCARVPWFSNPDVNRGGDTTGVALTATEPEHNVEVFALNDGQICRYRCLRTGAAANVWMKDRWEDTGGEPDAATAGKAMWQSPYIWVRLTADPTSENAHEHEDPRQGQTNHVYVKLHNTGDTGEAGDLELYYASASTSLNNPANWTLIDSRSLTIPSGGDTIHFEWINPPGSGHYCLLARWNTSGSAVAFTNLDDAVRNDNDLIWRNVNVIPLGGDEDVSVDLELAGDHRGEDTYLLITTRPMSRRKINWSNLVQGHLKINPRLLDRSSMRVVGMEQINPGTFHFRLSSRPKLVGPINLPEGRKSRLGLHFRINKAAVKATGSKIANPAHFEVSILQIRKHALDTAIRSAEAVYRKKAAVVGGVTYTLELPAVR